MWGGRVGGMTLSQLGHAHFSKGFERNKKKKSVEKDEDRYRKDSVPFNQSLCLLHEPGTLSFLSLCLQFSYHKNDGN
jgi:hypothetical protein